MIFLCDLILVVWQLSANEDSARISVHRTSLPISNLRVMYAAWITCNSDSNKQTINNLHFNRVDCFDFNTLFDSYGTLGRGINAMDTF